MEKEWLEHLAPYQNHTLILGCSGGVDSMTLLHFLSDHKFDVHVVHVNYHQRGKESDKDQFFVEETANRMKSKCSVFHYSEEQATSTNFQESARNFRYHCFDEVASVYEKSVIVLAHHADDQVETFFMNLSRKSGILGLAGMLSVRENVIRPMIWSFKSDILAYAESHKIDWREDASNHSNNYYRNRWRNEFIPLIEKEIPNVKNGVILLMKLFQEEQKKVENSIQEILDKINRENQVDLKEVESFNLEERFELWRQLGQHTRTFDLFNDISNLAKGKKIEMIGRFSSVSNELGTLFFIPTKKDELPIPKLIIESLSDLPETFSKTEIYLDKALLSNPLTIRRWEIGDRIASLGIAGTQLVSDILKDAKVPNHQKKDVFVVEDAKHIHWVVGFKIGRKAIAQKSSKAILKVGIRTFDHSKA